MGSLRAALSIALIVVAGRSEAFAQDRQTNGLDISVVNAIRDATRIYIYTVAGDRMVGTRPTVSADAIDLWVEGQWRKVPLVRVSRIDTASHDSLIDGAATGAAVFGILCAFVCGQGLKSASELPGTVAVNIGVGALVGAGIDAASRSRHTVYPIATPPSAAVFHGGTAALSYRIRF